MRTRLKSHLSEARSRYVIPRISVRRLLARILVLLAAVLPFVGSAIGVRCGDTPDQCGAAPISSAAHTSWAVGWGGHAWPSADRQLRSRLRRLRQLTTFTARSLRS